MKMTVKLITLTFLVNLFCSSQSAYDCTFEYELAYDMVFNGDWFFQKYNIKSASDCMSLCKSYKQCDRGFYEYANSTFCRGVLDCDEAWGSEEFEPFFPYGGGTKSIAWKLHTNCTVTPEGECTRWIIFKNHRAAKATLVDTLDNTDVDTCKTSCEQSVDCEGFDFNHTDFSCMFYSGDVCKVESLVDGVDNWQPFKDCGAPSLCRKVKLTACPDPTTIEMPSSTIVSSTVETTPTTYPTTLETTLETTVMETTEPETTSLVDSTEMFTTLTDPTSLVTTLETTKMATTETNIDTTSSESTLATSTPIEELITSTKVVSSTETVVSSAITSSLSTGVSSAVQSSTEVITTAISTEKESTTIEKTTTADQTTITTELTSPKQTTITIKDSRETTFDSKHTTVEEFQRTLSKNNEDTTTIEKDKTIEKTTEKTEKKTTDEFLTSTTEEITTNSVEKTSLAPNQETSKKEYKETTIQKTTEDIKREITNNIKDKTSVYYPSTELIESTYFSSEGSHQRFPRQTIGNAGAVSQSDIDHTTETIEETSGHTWWWLWLILLIILLLVLLLIIICLICACSYGYTPAPVKSSPPQIEEIPTYYVKTRRRVPLRKRPLRIRRWPRIFLHFYYFRKPPHLGPSTPMVPVRYPSRMKPSYSNPNFSV